MTLICGWVTFVALGNAAPGAAHPRLFVTADRIAQVREAIRQPGHHAAAFAQMRARLERGEEAYTGRSGYRRSALAREAAFAWQVTREVRYATLAYATLMASRTLDDDQPDKGYGLSRAMMAVGYALAYDWCFDGWTEQQRADVLAVLLAAADNWPNFEHPNVRTEHKGSNWVGVTRGGELIQHLAARGDGEYGRRDDRIALCVADLTQHVKTAYGPSGWTQEGPGYLEYTFGFLAPAVYAARAAGFDELWREFQRHDWPRLAMMSRTFRERQAMLMSGVSGSHSSNEGFASLLWPLVGDAERGAYRFFYDRHAGVLSPTPSFDGNRAGTIWALLYYPESVGAAEPVVAPLFDAEKGAYFFRNRWRDRDDVLISLITRNDHHGNAWSQPEAWQIAISAFDTSFAEGPVKERGPEFFSTLLIDGQTLQRPNRPGSREIRAEAGRRGGGTVVSDASAASGLREARRRFTVDFPATGRAAALISVRDELAAEAPFVATWQLRPERGVAVEEIAGTTRGFRLRKGPAWLEARILSPGNVRVHPGRPVRVEAQPANHVEWHVEIEIGRDESASPPVDPRGANPGRD